VRRFEFIETPFFTKALSHYLEDDDYAKLQNYLNEQPDAGVIVSGSAARESCPGIRKVTASAADYGSYITCGALAGSYRCSQYTEKMYAKMSPHTF
jgi:hypothetical protein